MIYRARHSARFLKASQDDYSSDSSFDENEDRDVIEKSLLFVSEQSQDKSSVKPTSWGNFAAVLGFLVLTTVSRPSTPYNMMSATLPFAMMEMFKPMLDICIEQAALNGNQWPFSGLIEKSKWESPKGHFKGWAPGSTNNYVKQYRETVPKWLPEVIPSGFSKWPPRNTTQDKNNQSCFGAEVDGTFYNPVSDPLKITNLNDNILDVLQNAFNNESVKIRHVALVMLESYREELFPLQQGSDCHQIIMKSHGDADEDEVNARLSKLCPVAERITGKSGNFKRKE
jgi:hypothetical protein